MVFDGELSTGLTQRRKCILENVFRYLDL